MKKIRLAIVICATFALFGTMLSSDLVKAGWNPPPKKVTIHVYPPTPTNPTPIQNAVNSVVWPWITTIHVHTGAYEEYVIIDSSKSGLKIVADPGTVLDGASLGCPPPPPGKGHEWISSGIMLVGADYVTIQGFTIRNFCGDGIFVRANYSGPVIDRANGNEIKGNEVDHNGLGCEPLDGISLRAADSNTVSGNNVHDNGRFGVFVDDGVLNIIKSNGVYNNMNTGIELHIASRTQLKNNTVTMNRWNGLYADGYSPSCNIRNNTFDNNVGRGMFVISDKNTILANMANHNKLDGIMIAQGDSNVIKGNQANWNNYIGIYVTVFLGMYTSDWNTIINNTANYNGDYGILIGGVDYNVVSANQANWNGYVGIGVRAYPGFPMYAPEYNTITSNTVNYNGAGGRGIGILIVAGDYNLVGMNEASSNIWHGISIISGHHNTVEGNELSFNGQHGIALDLSLSNTILANNVHNNSQHGVFMQRASDYNVLKGNTVCNNTWTGIECQDAAYTQVMGNTVKYNSYGLIADAASPFGTIAANTFDYNYCDGIYVASYNNTIAGNSVNYNFNGIKIDGGDFNSIVENQVTGNWGYGIVLSVYLYFGSDIAVYNNITYNTVIYNQYSGIFIHSANYTLIQYNNASFNYEHGIGVGNWLGLASNYNTITYNYAKNNDNNYVGTGYWFDLYWDGLGGLASGNTWRDSGINTNTFGTSQPLILP